MEGRPQLIVRLLADSSTRFIIPLYQRNYDWKEQHCRQLFDDLMDLHNTPSRTNHFFGSIVSRQMKLSSDEMYLIDGQQRITTVSLLLIALYNAAKAGDISYEKDITLEKIWRKYLVDEFIQTERKVKLKPIKNDMAAFDALLYKKESEYISNSNVTKNYRLFYNWATTSGLSVEEILASIEKLIVIDIRLNEDDDPQLIFESLNSTGKDLEEADKIRNYLLMALSPEEQEKYYANYWNKIEEYTAYKPTLFIRDYLTIKTRVISRIDDLYNIFKCYVKDNMISRKEILADMLPYAEYNYRILNSTTNNKSLNKILSHLATIDSTIGQPFYIAFLKHAEENNISAFEITKVFSLIENYWARRIICNAPTNTLNKVFSTLHYDIMRIIEKQRRINPEESISYSDVLIYFLLQKQGTAYFPKDAYLWEQFQTRQIYYIPASYKYFLFERLENLDNVEEIDVVNMMKEGRATIEHILPQTLNSEWKQALGENAESIQEKYLHTFANLTLTGYNTNYSNHSFAEKKTGYVDRKGTKIYGFNDSSFHLNNFLKQCDKWTEEELLQRQEILFKKFLYLWPLPTTDFVAQEPTDIIDFDTDDNRQLLTGRKIYAYEFRGQKSGKFNDWVDMLVDICAKVYNINPAMTKELCRTNGNFSAVDKSASSAYKKFAEGCWVWKSNSTWTKWGIIRQLFDAVNIPYSDLRFELVPQREDDLETYTVDEAVDVD